MMPIHAIGNHNYLIMIPRGNASEWFTSLPENYIILKDKKNIDGFIPDSRLHNTKWVPGYR